MVRGFISSTVPMITGILSRRVTASRVATTRWTGRGMKQTTSPTPKAPVTPRRQSPQRRGSAILVPKRRRNQRLSKEPGDGQMRFKSLRGMVWGRTLSETFHGLRPTISRGRGTRPRPYSGATCRASLMNDIHLVTYRLEQTRRSCNMPPSAPAWGAWMWEIVRAGGPLMWPIILCSITAAAIILERLWTLQDRRVLPQEPPQKGWQLIEANQINDKVIAALEQNSPLGKLLATGLANRHRPREILMERLEDTGRHVVHELERFLNTLGTIAGVSPLLGLLGTVTGIIRAFNAIQAGGMGDPRALSGGIAEALICTVAGLCVAIPALIFYRYLRGRVEGIVVEMEKQAIRMADALEAARLRERSTPAAVA